MLHRFEKRTKHNCGSYKTFYLSFNSVLEFIFPSLIALCHNSIGLEFNVVFLCVIRNRKIEIIIGPSGYRMLMGRMNATPPKSTLAKIVLSSKQTQPRPIRIMVVGTSGIGKTGESYNIFRLCLFISMFFRLLLILFAFVGLFALIYFLFWINFLFDAQK